MPPSIYRSPDQTVSPGRIFEYCHPKNRHQNGRLALGQTPPHIEILTSDIDSTLTRKCTGGLGFPIFELGGPWCFPKVGPIFRRFSGRYKSTAVAPSFGIINIRAYDLVGDVEGYSCAKFHVNRSNGTEIAGA